MGCCSLWLGKGIITVAFFGLSHCHGNGYDNGHGHGLQGQSGYGGNGAQPTDRQLVSH